MANTTVSRCGFVAIVGRPNVGKSTLLNYLIGQKISITSRKPQTTRDRVVGIRTEAGVQMVFVDTPGLHATEGRALNRHMNREALSALDGVDVVLMVIDAARWTDDDERVLTAVKACGKPAILVINKVDTLADKTVLLPLLDRLHGEHDFAHLIPVSALKCIQLESLLASVAPLLPEGEPLYGDDQITDRSERFLVSELIREKILRQLGEEVPHRVAVGIERFERAGSMVHIDAIVLVEKPGQKAILIGQGGQRLKRIGEAARADMETLLDARVMLGLWVKVRSGWSDDERALRSLGYHAGDRGR